MEKIKINLKRETILQGIKESILLSLKDSNNDNKTIIIEINNCKNILEQYNLKEELENILSQPEIKNYLDLNKKQENTNKPKKKMK